VIAVETGSFYPNLSKLIGAMKAGRKCPADHHPFERTSSPAHAKTADQKTLFKARLEKRKVEKGKIGSFEDFSISRMSNTKARPHFPGCVA
jgi:hypothetical protein